jgi:hypothetical protein
VTLQSRHRPRPGRPGRAGPHESGVHHFADQVTVAFAGLQQQQAARVAELAPVLDRYGGTAGLLVEEAGPLACWPGVDALIVSTDNAMT